MASHVCRSASTQRHGVPPLHRRGLRLGHRPQGLGQRPFHRHGLHGHHGNGQRKSHVLHPRRGPRTERDRGLRGPRQDVDHLRGHQPRPRRQRHPLRPLRALPHGSAEAPHERQHRQNRAVGPASGRPKEDQTSQRLHREPRRGGHLRHQRRAQDAQAQGRARGAARQAQDGRLRGRPFYLPALCPREDSAPRGQGLDRRAQGRLIPRRLCDV